MTNFMNSLQDTMLEDYNVSFTENGAEGYKTTGHPLLDMNYKISSYRNMTEKEIISDFITAFLNDPQLSLKWLFYIRDVRGGLGERRLFRIILRYLVKNYPSYMESLLPYIPEYGRWDDLIDLVTVENNPLGEDINTLIFNQWTNDIVHMSKGEPVSLLGKWLPSENASSHETKKKARIVSSMIELSPREYRKSLSQLRAYIDVVESKISNNRWSEVDYNTVPSKANLKYSNAFMKHDPERRQDYLKALSQGKAKINAGVLYPHEIYYKYVNDARWSDIDLNRTYEELWKNLPNVSLDKTTLVVADGSDSMRQTINGSRVSALDVSRSLAIYCSERCKNEYKDKFITFSSQPEMVDLSNCTKLYEKINVVSRYDDCTNTNIEKVFDLILNTAVSHNLPNEDLPDNILLISDMEFDSCVRSYDQGKLFKVIESKYKAKGYQLPRLVFWNTMSRTGTIPFRESPNGVVLMSGFSVNALKMVMSSEIDPWKVLLETLNSERYNRLFA